MWLSSTLVSIGSYWGFAINFFIQYSSNTSGYANKRANRYVVLPYRAVFPVFSSASLSPIAPCSSAVYSHLTTINSALASHSIVSPMAFPSLTALPLQQPFVVGPGYSPAPFKVVSQITAGKFVNLEDLLAENITMPEQEPQLLFNGQLVLSHTPKKQKDLITDIAS